MNHWKMQIDRILTDSMTLIADRFDRGGYPFIDTKFDIVTGRDFGENDEPFRRKECVYAWIQGRGLESLAKHILYFRQNGNPVLAERLANMLQTVATETERLRAINNGQLPFAMTPEGKTFFHQEPSAGNYSGSFYGKGLFAAGNVLDNDTWRAGGQALFCRVLTSIREQTFRTDQQSFDPKNKVEFVPGKFPQGPRMIALGGLADLMAAEPENPVWADTAEEFIRFIMENHVNQGQFPELQKWDFVESLDAEKKCWKDGDMVFSDPGHALEFAGLAGKCLLVLQKQGKKAGLIADAAKVLPEIFVHVFDYGYNPYAGGICKGYDLTSRKAVNSDMPWWSLPETTRAGAQLLRLYPGIQTAAIAGRTGEAMQAFMQGFLQKNGFGCQTRDAEGKIIQVIPAVSDADPGYHTNLSLMDVL
ncbi:MAG: AGE family epimerase/isomerase [Lentisphaeria bacterium]|nr:AGE family epimerase/isomerase [Lentisphaeria bacterium]